MTKYGAYVQAVDRDAPPEWRGKFIRYKALKKALKECAAAAAAAADASEETVAASRAAEAGFFDLLKQELLRVNRCFVTTAESVTTSFQRTEMRRRLACCFPRLLLAGPSRYASLAERAYWARKYARANAVALRKILKKYDKQTGGQRGRAFLQHCWRMPSGGAFLHSPLLDELKALQDCLQEQRMRLATSRGGGVPHPPPRPPRGRAAAPPAAGDQCHAAVKGGAALAAGEPSAPADSAASLGGSRGLLPHGHLHLDSCGASASSCGLGCCASHSHHDATGLEAIVESPSCMLSSSDFEWAQEDPTAAGGSSGAAPPTLGSDDLAFACGPPSLSSTTLSPSTASRAAAAGSAAAAAAAAAAAPSAAAAGGPAGLPPPPDSPGRAALSRFKDEELHCPICLETLFKPVGLSCGHKFCKQCALEHAGLGKAIGTFVNLCSYVAPSIQCPQCRQPGVYRRAVRMRQLDRVLKARFSTEWQERRQEEKQRERAFMEQAASAESMGRWISVREALLAL